MKIHLNLHCFLFICVSFFVSFLGVKFITFLLTFGIKHWWKIAMFWDLIFWLNLDSFWRHFGLQKPPFWHPRSPSKSCWKASWTCTCTCTCTCAWPCASISASKREVPGRHFEARELPRGGILSSPTPPRPPQESPGSPAALRRRVRMQNLNENESDQGIKRF